MLDDLAIGVKRGLHPIVLQCRLPMFVKQKVERLEQCSLSRRCEQLVDDVNI